MNSYEISGSKVGFKEFRKLQARNLGQEWTTKN